MKERTGEAEAAAIEGDPESYPPTESKRKIGLPASSQPYTSRDVDGIDREKKVGVGEGEGGGATAARNNGKRGATPRRRKKKLSWWQKPMCLIGLVSFVEFFEIGREGSDAVNLLLLICPIDGRTFSSRFGSGIRSWTRSGKYSLLHPALSRLTHSQLSQRHHHSSTVVIVAPTPSNNISVSSLSPSASGAIEPSQSGGAFQPSLTAGPTAAGGNRPVPTSGTGGGALVGGDTGADSTTGGGGGVGIPSTVLVSTSTRVM